MSDAATATQAASASAAVPAHDAMPRPMRVAESAFDVCYLLFDLVATIVFLAKRIPAVGALMLPKTVTYMWMIAMGLQLLARL